MELSRKWVKLSSISFIREDWQVCVGVSEHAQVLNDVGVSYGTHELILLLKASNGQSMLSLRGNLEQEYLQCFW